MDRIHHDAAMTISIKIGCPKDCRLKASLLTIGAFKSQDISSQDKNRFSFALIEPFY
jgi:hypothetical protein